MRLSSSFLCSQLAASVGMISSPQKNTERPSLSLQPHPPSHLWNQLARVMDSFGYAAAAAAAAFFPKLWKSSYTSQFPWDDWIVKRWLRGRSSRLVHFGLSPASTPSGLPGLPTSVTALTFELLSLSLLGCHQPLGCRSAVYVVSIESTKK